MVLKLLGRGHKTAAIMKGWNKHLNKYAHDRITNYTRLRHWFRRMLKWALYHYKETVTTAIWKPKQSYQTLTSKPVWKPTLSNHANDTKNQRWVPKQQHPTSNSEQQQQKNKQFCKDFLSQMNTIVPEPPQTSDLKNTTNTGKTEHDQTNKNECTTNFEKLSHYTTFEALLLKYKDSHICPKCDQHYWKEDKIQSKGHLTVCRRAQSVKTKLLLQEHSPNHDVPPSQPTVSSDDDPLQKEHEHGTTFPLQNPTVTIDNDIQKWEKDIQWPFITFNNDLMPNLVTILNDFQKTPYPTNLSLFEEKGVFGTLADRIAAIWQEVTLQPLKEYSYLYNLGSVLTGGVRVRYKLVHILLSGISFNKTKTLPQIRHPMFIKCNDWLIDEHIEVIRLLLLSKKVLRSTQGGHRLSSTSVCMNSFFAKKLLDEPEDALDWLRHTLYRHDLLFDHALLLEELCVPVNLSNTHWIMIFIDLKHGTFFPINPYHPTDPTDSELTLGFKIASTIADTFGLQTPVQRSPDYCHRLPIQKPADFINCGVYVCLYMVIYSFGSMSKQYVGDLLPRSIGECRLLLLSWILRGEIYFLPPDNKQR